MNRTYVYGIFVGLAFSALGCSQTTMKESGSDAVTLAIVNGRVWTGESSNPWSEAVAVEGDSIVAVGSSASINRLTDAKTRVIDAKGHLVTPGFTDCHLHVISGGFAEMSIDIRDCRSPEEFVARIGNYAKNLKPGEWLVGHGWDHELWGGELPTRKWIDSVTPENPVWISRLDGHMGLANSAALEAAGVTKDTPDIEGGVIVRDARGEPTGILKDQAEELVSDFIPEPTEAQCDEALEVAMNYFARNGITSVHDMGSEEEAWRDLVTFERAWKSGRLRTRIRAAVGLEDWDRLKKKVAEDGSGDEWLSIGCLKGYMDGSLGSRTAALLEPYDDAPDHSGLFVFQPEENYKWTSSADKAELSVQVHAIGDRGIRMMLEIYEKVIRENGDRDRRFRIEHSQHVDPEDVPRYAPAGVIASMQPIHIVDDGCWAGKRIGSDREPMSYVFRSFLDAGVRVVLGSDWPVANASPVRGIDAAVTRRTADGKNPGGWVPEQKMSVEEALRAYTVEAAYASFEESRKGTIEPGKVADLILLDRDLTTIAPEEIRDTEVLMTIVGGTVVYEQENAR